MKKKIIIPFLLILCLLISTMSACAPSKKAVEVSDGQSDNKDQQESSKNIEQLIIGTTAGNSTFNASTQTDIFGRMNYNVFTQGNFVYRDENNILQPYFFRTFDISDDGMKITFTVPTDAVWHDGKPVTSEDILFTFDFMKDVKKVGSLQNLETVNKLEEDKFEMVFSKPDAYYWINSSSNNNACVFAKHIWENIENPAEYTAPEAAIGCGPYKLVSNDIDAQSSYYEAVPQNDYVGSITVDSVTLQSYSGEDTLMMAMMNGEIDAMFNYANPIDVTIIETMQNVSDINLGESPYAGNYQLAYGMERAPGKDIAFRKAIQMGLDYKQLGTTINGSYGKAPGVGILPPTSKGYDSSLPTLSQDIEKAKAMLDEAGYLDVDGDGWRELPDGTKMVVLVTPQYSKSSQDLLNRIADVIMDSVGKLGIKTALDEESLANSEVWEANMTDGKYDLFIGYTTSGMASYSTAFRYFLADARDGETTWIWGTYHSDEFRDTLFAMTEAISEDVYIANAQKLQKMAAEDTFGQALSWETAFFPYRTDKYTGWNNYPSWGVINPRTWHDLEKK